MSKMKSWMMDMEEAVVDCIENGASSMSDVLAGVRTAVPICDDKFVMEYVKTIMAPDEADQLDSQPQSSEQHDDAKRG